MKSDFPYLDESMRGLQREPIGYYIPPRRVVIAGMESLIADPHNEVLPHWYKVANPPAVVVHIDNHSDMGASAPTFKIARKEWTWENIDSREKYAKHCLSVENFIAVAIHDGLVGVVYHFDLREDIVHAYGRIRDGKLLNQPRVKIDNKGRMKWDSKGVSLTPEDIMINQFFQDLKDGNYPTILDIDLDAYLCTKDPVGQDPSVYQARFKKVQDLLSRLPKPKLITLARSQTTTLWCPPDKVNQFERETIDYLNQLYQV